MVTRRWHNLTLGALWVYVTDSFNPASRSPPPCVCMNVSTKVQTDSLGCSSRTYVRYLKGGRTTFCYAYRPHSSAVIPILLPSICSIGPGHHGPQVRERVSEWLLPTSGRSLEWHCCSCCSFSFFRNRRNFFKTRHKMRAVGPLFRGRE